MLSGQLTIITQSTLNQTPKLRGSKILQHDNVVDTVPLGKFIVVIYINWFMKCAQ